MYVFLGVTEDVVVVGALVPEEALEEGECGCLQLCPGLLEFGVDCST